MMKKSTSPKPEKAVVRSDQLSFGEQMRLLERRSADFDRRAADYDRQAKSNLEQLVELRKRAEADRDQMVELRKKAEADRDRLARLESERDKEREAAVRRAQVDAERAQAAAKQAEADRDRLARLESERESERDKEREAAIRRAQVAAKQAEADAERAKADRDRLERLENGLDKERKDGGNHRDRFARILENTFAASLPGAMEKAHGIKLNLSDIRVRARENNHSAEFDFIAPNGELVLVGEVKTHLTVGDVREFHSVLQAEFREQFPQYAHLPLYGVVAGGEIDEEAAKRARKLGFYILHLEGGEIHPDTGRAYSPKAY